ncbi:hypothetical protein [Oceanirhabdus sp. W0125-5]|uniref:hypothetical protein n=1 Tax=Oceanirhabdus sp. W0125-5 TaxID=2999116 RepID=UPI0022F2D634|nr:hypothetical protein [Oceanirhabdus sp. W0125-5]WBW96978.1 hypothetical protein OW730_25305 [Oceanirhabdus sp. W0125-5]
MEIMEPSLISVVYALFVPLGIFILCNLESVAEYWYEKSLKHIEKYPSPFYAKPTSIKWNKFIFRLIGITLIFMGSVAILFATLYFLVLLQRKVN